MDLPIHLLSDNFVKTKKITEDTPFEIQEINARELLCSQRLDLAAKIAYIEARENNADMSFAKELYRKHIEAFSEGNYTEPGDSNKTSLEKFFSIFDELIDDFKENGFDASKSLIPVGRDNIILDGAHRTACAIYVNKKVSMIRFSQFSSCFDYRYFRKRRLSEEMLEYMAVIYSHYSIRQLYLACLWPISEQKKRSKAVERIQKEHDIVLDTTVNLKKNGLRNFMLQIYQHQDWVGTVENHFSGVMGKVDSCFMPGVSTETILFEDGSLDAVLKMKDEIRNIFHLDKHAIHISDSNEETELMANLLFNENSRHALNYGKPDTFPNCYIKMKKLLSKDVICLNSEATLAYYGILEKKRIVESYECVDLYNPRTYFVFEGMKLPSLEKVKEYLKKIDDRNYVVVSRVIRKYGANSTIKRKIEDTRTKLIWNLQKLELRCKQLAMLITKKIGIYEILHSILKRE